jgi:hypothetical protein
MNKNNLNTKNAHNLNIHMYNLQDILGLFDLTYDISVEDLKRAKKKVLMLHPDKSKLCADYFLFYKKAFDIVVQFYKNNNRQNQEITPENTKYNPLVNDFNKSTYKQVNSVINKMKPDDFNNKFNQLFDANMVQKSNPNRNEWFSKDEPIYNIDKNVSVNNMGQVLENIKQKNSEIIRYNGVQELYVSGGVGSKLYGGDGDEGEDDDSEQYFSSDPFSKLKFDDLRKVHKDQTVFAVSEKDIHNIPQYSSVDHFVRERSKQPLTPLEKQEAEYYLAMKDKQYREKIMQKEHSANLKSMEYAEKNKTVLSNFLRLGM